MSEGSGSQRFCGNCGTEIRSGTTFCVSCGIPANGGPASPGSDNSVPPPTPSRSFADTLSGTFSGLTRLFSNARSSSGRVTLGGLTTRGINRFRDLPSVTKLILVGLLLMLLLTVLSPVARVVAIIVFVVSAVVLVIRAIQRKPLRGWTVAVVGSLVLIPVFGGISGAIYGGLPGSNGPELNGDSSLVGSPDEGIPAMKSGGYEQELIVPKDVVESWSSQVPSDLYILVPLYLPFEAEGYFEETFGEEPYPTYHVGSGLVITVQDAFLMTGIEPDGTVAIDGHTYYYEGSSMCSLRLWEPEGRQPAFSVLWLGTICASQPEEAVSTLESMIRVEGTGGENW